MLNVEDLREIADALLAEDTEAHVRSAINRYYYYCHLRVRQVNQRHRVAEFGDDRTDHRTAVRILQDLGLHTHGSMLNRLLSIRGKADYDLGWRPEEHHVRTATTLVERLDKSIDAKGLLG